MSHALMFGRQIGPESGAPTHPAIGKMEKRIMAKPITRQRIDAKISLTGCACGYGAEVETENMPKCCESIAPAGIEAPE
jgi:hypothetical protein